LPGEQVSSQLTLMRIEAGAPSVAIGAYLQVLMVRGLESSLGAAAENYELGLTLQDLGLRARKRMSTRKAKNT